MSIAKIGCHKPSARGDIRCTLLYLSDEIHDSDINFACYPCCNSLFLSHHTSNNKDGYTNHS